MWRTKSSLLLLASVALVGMVCSGASAATLNVAAGGDLQAALDGAACGDTIVLQAGASYTTTYGFVLPNKVCTGTDADYITVTTNGPLPPAGTGSTRRPTRHPSRSSSPRENHPIISTRTGAHHWRFVGIEFTSDGSQSMPSLVTFGFSSVTGDEPTWAQRQSMKGFVLDRCFIHPPEISRDESVEPTTIRHVERGIHAEAADVWVINSYIAGFTGTYPEWRLDGVRGRAHGLMVQVRCTSSTTILRPGIRTSSSAARTRPHYRSTPRPSRTPRPSAPPRSRRSGISRSEIWSLSRRRVRGK